MSMYKFVKGARLFMQGKREDEDTDDVADGNGIMDEDDAEIRAVHTFRNTEMEGTTSGERWSKSVKKGNIRHRSTRTVRKVTTITRGEQSVRSETVLNYANENKQSYPTINNNKQNLKFRVIEKEDLTAKEALLRWAQKTTQKYPGVHVTDFTQSWRDGLAFNAIIHRNRPDLVDWRQVERRQVRERIDLAFHVMDREYGVTRLLDPEDVDTPEPDEKSIITYVSQLYDVFPEPPPGHPLFDAEATKKMEMFRDLASSLQQWIKEHITIMQDRNFPNSLNEMKQLAEDSNRFRNHDLPPRLKEKEKLFSAFRDLERQMKDANFDLNKELYPENIERSWSHLMMLYQERDQLIQEEIVRLEKLQRLAEKIHQEAKMTDSKLDDIEAWIEDEAKRIDHLHPKDAKNNCDQIERELSRSEEVIKSMFSDVQILRDNRFHQSQELHRSVKQTYEHWTAIRATQRANLLTPLNEATNTTVVRIEADGQGTVITMGGVGSETNAGFRFLLESLDWVAKTLKQLKEGEYGTDMQTVKLEYERHQKEHKVIDQFQGNVEKCREAEVKFHGEELKIYGERMTVLQKAYNELLVLSNKRVSDLHSLHDFMAASHAELSWLNEREDREAGRDWADKNLKINEVEQYYEKLMSELEKRETQFSSVLDRGESLIISHHPASQVIEAHMAAMQGKWAWLLQLTLCLETHLKYTSVSQRFFQECTVAEEWMTTKEETMNNHFSQTEFKLEDGENLLKEMQQLREELASYEDEIQKLIEGAQDIVPLRQRRERLRNPIEAVAICKYSSSSLTISKDEVVTVRDNTNKAAWKITTSRGQQGEAPAVMFLLPPPDQEAIDTAEKLKRHYDRVITLWQKKHLRMRQNMIFATIKVVKSWDYQQYISMDKETRTNIRRALNEDADKLIQEGEPNDPQLRRLEREIAEVNRLFDEWERRAAMDDEKRNATKLFENGVASLEMTLNEYEKTIIKVCKAPLPRDVETLQSLVITHKEFESDLQSHELDVDNVKTLFSNIPQKTQDDQNKLDKVLDQWDRIWSYSSYYVERLKTVEITLTGLEEVTTVVTEFEMKLASYDSMPSDMDNLRKAHDDLMTLEADIQEKQVLIDQLTEDVKMVRPAVEKTRPSTTKNPDVDRLEEDVNRMTKRWGNCCMQVVERLRSCEAACELLEKYNMSYQTETNWMDELDSKLRNLEELEAARAKEAWEKHVQAVQEKYRQAGENLENLNRWLEKVEREIASQEVPREDSDKLRNQINGFKEIKDDVDEHNRPVNNTLDIIAELVETGADVLSSAELNKLQQEGKQLKVRYDNVSNNSDKLLKRLVSAHEELLKFNSEVTAFRNWLEKAYKVLEDKEKQLANLNKVSGKADDIKEFVSDVMTHGADLKFLSISGQKFVSLSKEYVSSLNEFRLVLRQNNLKITESIVSEEVNHVSSAYHDLLARANALSDAFSMVGGKYKDYNDAVDRAKRWLKETEPKVAKICNEPVAAEPRVVEDQLNRAKALNNEIIANAKLIDDAKQAAANLLASLDDSQMSREERRLIEQTPLELQQRYDALRLMMNERCADLDSALVACQGVQDALANIANWLDSTDNMLAQIMKPASLIRERLDEQIRQLYVLKSDVESHEPSIHKMYESAQQFIQSSSNVRETKKIETKVKEVQKKFETLVKTVQTREIFFNEVSTVLEVFTSQVESFEVWYLETIDFLESKELLQMNADESAAKIDELVRRKEQMKPQYDEMIKNGKALVTKKDVTDAGPCKDTIKELEEKWRELGDILGERQASNRARKQSLNAYEALREQVFAWLNKMESRIEDLDPIALDLDMLNKQINDVKPLVQEYTGYSKTIDKLNELGMQYDNMMRGSIDMGSLSRRSSMSPRKPSLTPSLLSGGSRRASASPKFGPPGSPLRRESGMPMFQEASPIQTQLAEINNRYDMIGIKLGDRDSELTNMRDDVKKYHELLKNLATFLEKQERNFPQDSIPSDKREADKQLKVLKAILDQLYENQGQLDTARVNIKDLLKKNPEAPGSEILDDTLNEVSLRWKDLQERCKARASMLDEMKDFHDIHDNLNNWLNSKEKLMNILGPIASDPRLVQNQMSQIQVMKEEFNEKQPSKDRFNDIGENILEVAGASADGRNIEQKLDNINGKWDDLLSQLEERERALEAISGPTRDFLNLSNRLADNLSKVSDDLDDIAVSKGDAEAKLKALTAVAKTLDDQRPLFSEVMSLGDQLQQILTDPASKSEIKGKMGQVERQFNNCQRKLDNALAELENSAKEGKEFEGQCADAQAWLREMEGILSDKFSISADRQTLIEQVAEFDPIYKEVMSKEHEIIMILNRGKDIIAKAPKADVANIKKNLDSVEKSWQKVKKISQDRHNKLNICMEYCKKFYGAQEKFLPWLEKAEAQLERMEVISLVLAELKKQEKELQSFRNDVNRHSSEYDLNHGSGDTFQSSCDTDKEIVKEELAHMKERWDHLNYFISERAQAISDLIGKLGDFNDNARDLSNGLQRAEDKLKQTDGANKDPRLLDKIKGLLEEAKELEKDFGKVQKTGEDLLTDADVLGADGSPIADIVNGLGDRLGNLRDRLEDKAEDLKNAGAAVGEFNEAAKDIGNALAMLDDELNKMGPIARELKALYKQKEEVSSFLQRIGGKKKDILALIENSKQLINSGVVPNPRELQDTVSGLQKSIEKLEQRGVSRDKDIDEMIKKVQAFYDHYATVMNDIQEVVREEKNLGAVAGDTETIKSQLVQFKQFQAKVVSAVGKEVDKSNRSGQGLIQSAASGVNTNGIETDLEKMNELWNSLKQALAERERKLDQGLLQSGKYGEALNGLMSWMDEMEDMMTNQKPPSADYKVVKAQVQEQKFVQKLLHDRKGAVASLIKTGQEIAASADPAEKRRIEGEIRALEDRYGSLNLKCSDRMALLEDAMKMAKEYADKLGPLEKWLDKTEKKIKEMETVPTEEDQIQKRIREHEIVHDDIIEKQSNFDDLADVASALMQVVGDEDAQMLADKVEELTNRYANLVHNSDAIAQLLQDSMAGLRNLVMAYEDLLGWMEDCETRLSKFKILSVFTEKLMEQTEQLHEVTEEIVKKQSAVDDVLAIGTELMKHITNEEALSLKDKLDSLQRKYNDLASKASDLLKNAQDMLPLVQNFHESHNRISDWMEGVEGVLQSLDTYSLEDQESEIHRLEGDIQQHKPLLEGINLTGPQLCQLSPGEGARTIEGLVTRDNRRFDAICEQVQRRGERIALAKQKSGEVLGDIDELLSWFREVEQTIREADPPSHEPEVIRVQLKEHKALNDDISSQKGRVRDVLSNAKKVLRESAQTADTEQVREKMEDLKETMDTVIKLSSDRLNILESALPLAEHFYETHAELNEWLDDIEREVMNQMNPSMRPDQIARQQETVRSLMQSVQDHKPVVDRLNKTGGALLRLIVEDDSYRVQDIIESDNQRYNNIKADLRERMQALEDAMHECSQFTDKLDGMLNSLENTKDQLVHAEPISGHPEKIKEQMDDNNAIIDDLEKKEVAYEAVIKAADDIIQKAPNKQDPAIKDIKKKLDKLTGLWKEIQGLAKNRGDSLEDALALAEKFWDELQQVMSNLKDLQDQLDSQDPPAVEPKAIEAQKAELKEIKRGIDSTKPGYEKCRQSGNNLINVVGDSEKPELKRHIEDLDHAWDNITSMYARREQNLFEAMEKAMEFHDMLQSLLEFLARSEKKFDNLGAIGTDIDTVKKQIEELRKFKDEVDPWMVKIEALNRSLRRQADDLTERTSPDQARAIKEPLADVNRRWNDLNKGIVVRQKELEHALLRLGQFQHALSELLVWIDRTDKTLDTLKPVYGDPQVIEVELAKLKVIVNDIQAHQSSVDTLNDAGRQIIESEKGSREASHTQQKLNELNTKWNNLLTKGEDRQAELEDALREAQAFNQEIQDMLMWLNDVDTALSTSKPVGGLPETARDQLERFMEVYHDLDATAPKIDALLGRGHEYLKKSKDGQATNLSNNLKTLKARWDNILNRANDKKIKLEIALKEATEFHEALQAFIDWLTNAEKHLGNLKPVSRIMETILVQIEEHKEFQAEVSSQRETMLSLDKKGTHLKYFSQKQDVILIKNLLVSVQHRWEKVVSKSAERTRALDYGYKEAKEFHDAWDFMMGWLDEAHIRLDDMSKEVKNDPEKIKQQIMRHKEFQKELGEKQLMYDSTMKTGKTLIGKAPKTDEPVIKSMMTELKNKWNMICNLSVERQRKLEEALLFSGQFKDALKALMDWLAQMEKGLDDKQPVHGDLDTVIGLVEQHKNFEEELNSRSEQVEQLKQTAEELLRSAEKEDAVKIRAQVTELTNRWENVWDLSKNKTKRLEDALKLAEELHKSVNMLLEWLSDAEMKLRFAGPLPEDEEEVERQIADHARFMNELKEKEKDKDYTINLAQDILKKCHPDAVQVIKHWITIIQSRWDEVASWALQRSDKLEEHLKQLRELLALLDELMQWLIGKEQNLIQLEQEPLPDDLEIIQELLVEHQGFMDGLTERQPEIDAVCKPMRPKSQAPSSRRTSKAKGPGRDSREGSPDLDPSRRPSRFSPEREGSPNKSRKSSYYDRDGGSPQRDYPKPWLDFLNHDQSMADARKGPRASISRSSPGDRATPDRRGGPRFSERKGSRASVSQEGGIKNPRAKALWEKWRHVWVMAWERDRRLRDKLNYLQELENVKNFDWEEWRKRYLKFNNNKKSRVQDFFRKLDDDGDGYCPRDEFIDGILKNKFPSSKLEMNAVADKFDHGDGMIDWREFMVALRPDWEERGPLTDTQRIDDEIKRQVAQCTCRQKFKVFQVGEGKYRFGDSQKLRLVRILRSTVMVRVGGGWCALDEFLVKNDPCRVLIRGLVGLDGVAHHEHHEWFCPVAISEMAAMAADRPKSRSQSSLSRKSSASSRKSSSISGPPSKGRTNVELREQFTLAAGVSQSVVGFTSKMSKTSAASPTSSVSGEGRNGVSGPITKIKEKSERSIGMNVRSSVDYSYNDDPYSRRQSAAAGRNSLTPGSQPGSRPPSRHGSNMSLNSEDDGGRRGSNVRRSSSMRNGARGMRPTPVGFGSSVPRKTSTPGGDRNRTPSNSSTDRTPLSARMRSKSYITPRPSQMIKSTSESNIPVFVGCQSAINHASTPSSSQSPALSEAEPPNRKRSLIPRYIGRSSHQTSVFSEAQSFEQGTSRGLSEESFEELEAEAGPFENPPVLQEIENDPENAPNSENVSDCQNP
ncbi:dystonin isoform X21 [Eurytemora carolleeae]|uniref:dystonin isoform X21 n=1 Tax=Eurytemora carolleeae TaxID=1294199 RepID=UPI000C775A0E|nr:dystonin isoform X21 [Eurytemora carolleeae]|eukprot:XP_023339664.1 dystonin-like isoform X21 [Eurytemora affinis]